MALAKIPQTLRTAFVESEDRRFWQHHGIDWRARFAALWTDLRAGRAVRGASTISEQVVRILRPRPRTVRSEEHTSELQSLMRISYAVFCLKKKTAEELQHKQNITHHQKHSQQNN